MADDSTVTHNFWEIDSIGWKPYHEKEYVAWLGGEKVTAEQFNEWIEAGPVNPEPSDKFGDYDYE